jgi:hypothetical protein
MEAIAMIKYINEGKPSQEELESTVSRACTYWLWLQRDSKRENCRKLEYGGAARANELQRRQECMETPLPECDLIFISCVVSLSQPARHQHKTHASDNVAHIAHHPLCRSELLAVKNAGNWMTGFTQRSSAQPAPSRRR